MTLPPQLRYMLDSARVENWGPSIECKRNELAGKDPNNSVGGQKEKEQTKAAICERKQEVRFDERVV